MPNKARKQGAVAVAAQAGGAAWDVIIAGDMTRPGDRAFRIAQEARHHQAAGRRVGLLQASRPAPGSRISPEVQTCVRRKLAEVVEPQPGLSTDLLVVHAPSEISWTARRLAGIKSERTVLVCHQSEDFAVQRVGQRLRGSAEITWAPTNPWLREAAPARLPLTVEDWLPPLDPDAAPAPKAPAGGRAAIGWIEAKGALPLPAGSQKGLDLVPLRLDGARAEVELLSADQLSLDRIMKLDGLAYFPPAGEMCLPDALILTALSRGLVVALPSELKAHYGTGPLYCDGDKALAALAGALGNERARARRSEAARRAARKRAPDQPSDGPAPVTPNPAAPAAPRPMLLVASNGVGVGHVSRLLAIARRLDPDVPVVFVTQAQAVGVIERFGYLAEYLPSASYIGGSFADWDSWFRFELERLIDAYDPSLVVYDGNNPSDGLIRAVASRGDCRLAWVRRGLWGNTTSEFLDNSRWFDLIVEPGELEGQADEGVTAQRRDEANLVPPIRLLESDELLSRAEAAKALGLDPVRPSALIQLGAGYNRDIVSLIDHLVEVLHQHPLLQISIAEWVNGAHSLNYWPDVKYLRGYPLSQYFNAFDFSIAAAGYNTFHEAVSFGLPTIFIPNRHPAMDDQAGRAEHAQALHAAFELNEEDLGDLPELVTILMDAKARAFLAEKCRQLSRPNGALAAARSLVEMARMTA